MERINLKYWNSERVSGLVPENFVERELGGDLLKAMESGKIVFLYGPRQSGKSSLIGGIANLVWGEPRLTQDIYVTISIKAIPYFIKKV